MVLFKCEYRVSSTGRKSRVFCLLLKRMDVRMMSTWAVRCHEGSLMLALAPTISYTTKKALSFLFIEVNDPQITTSSPKDTITPSIFPTSFILKVKDQIILSPLPYIKTLPHPLIPTFNITISFSSPLSQYKQIYSRIRIRIQYITGSTYLTPSESVSRTNIKAQHISPQYS